MVLRGKPQLQQKTIYLKWVNQNWLVRLEIENWQKMKEDLYKLELEFDSKMKQLKKKEESLEEDLSYFLQQTDQLKEEVYRMAEGELPAEVHTYFFQMDENSERFRRDVFEQLDQIQEERSKLKWEYDNEIDAFYKNQKKLESKAKKNQ